MGKFRERKIYTRSGDKGKSKLIFGEKVGKDHPKLIAYGTIDELNASLGTATSFTTNKKIKQILTKIQNELFNIGAELAGEGKLKKKKTEFYELKKTKILELEKIIDRHQDKLPTLYQFILPSGSQAAAFLHLSRTICRRAERKVVSLSRIEKINPNIVAYLNRLSDLLFVLARYMNKKAGKKEKPWIKD